MRSWQITRVFWVLIMIIVIISSSLIVVFYALPPIQRKNTHMTTTNETVHLDISISYFGNWNGSYDYGNGCGLAAQYNVPWAGNGSRKVNLEFESDFYSGFGYSIQIQKDNNSSSLLNVTVIGNTSALPAPFTTTNSTSAPFGKVSWLWCAEPAYANS